MTSFQSVYQPLINSEKHRPLVIDNISIEDMPGIAGDICKEIESTEFRSLPELRPLAALSLLSLIANSRRTCLDGKIWVYSIGVALSASGKEAQISYVKKVIERLGLLNQIANKPRSDRSIVVSVTETNGQTLFICDEVHDLFNRSTKQNSASHEAGMIPLLLELATCSRFNVPETIKSPLIEKFEKELSNNLKKQNSSFDNFLSVDLSSEERRLKDIILSLSNGFKEPCVNLVGFTTPDEIDSLFTLKNIKSGLLGRFLILRNTDSRSPIRKPLQSGPSEEILKRLEKINSKRKKIVSLSEQALPLFSKIEAFFDLEELRNDTYMGAIFARASERILMVSTILALEDDEINEEHLRYSFYLFDKFINDCENFLNQNINGEKEIALEKLRGLILQRTTKIGCPYSTLKQNICRLSFVKKLLQIDPNAFDKVVTDLQTEQAIQLSHLQGGTRIRKS